MVQTVINKQATSIKVISHRSRYTCILYYYPIWKQKQMINQSNDTAPETTKNVVETNTIGLNKYKHINGYYS